MGDMADGFRAMKEYKKKRRAERLENADDDGWSKHTEHHWYRYIKGKKIDYWPSSGLCMYTHAGRRVKKNINGKYMRKLLASEGCQ